MTYKKDQRQGIILKVAVNSTHLKRVLAFVRANIAKPGSFFITTPNPEMVVYAQKDRAFEDILNSADLSIPDGIGLAQATAFLSLRSPKNILVRFFVLIFQGLWVGLSTFVNKKWLVNHLNTIKGRDLFLELMKLANKKRWRVFFLGGTDDEGEKTAKLLSQSFKGVRIDYFSGPKLNKNGTPVAKLDKKREKEAIDKINKFSPHLLFVAFGAPKQEKWIYKNINQLKIGGAMVVGGTFRYISGKARIPPVWIDKVGLEWVWRLFTEPKRMKRIFIAFPIFPLLVFWHKLKKSSKNGP